MKKLGEGWDYNVYALSETRVKKIRKTRPQLLWLLFRTVNIVPMFRAMFTDYAWSSIHPSCVFVQELIERKPDIAWFFGNPSFGENDSYTQDRVIPLRDYLSSVTIEQKKKILEEYAYAVQFMWRRRFSDTSFKFSKNYGVDNEGRVILIDFSNLTQDRDVIENLLEKDFLLKVWVYRKMTDRAARKHYRQVVQSRLTLQSFRSLWN